MSRVHLVFFSDSPVHRWPEEGINFGVPSILGVGINDGLHTACQYLETQGTSAVQLIEGSIMVAQPLLVLPLLEPESMIAAMLQEVLRTSQQKVKEQFTAERHDR